MTEAPQQNRGYSDSAVSDAAEVGKSLIAGVTPADKGWILGFCLVVGMIVGSDAFVSMRTMERTTQSNAALTQYLVEVERNRAEALERQAAFFGDQVRRSQEVIRDLAHAVARDSERAGMAAMTAIDRQSVSQSAPKADPDFIGPVKP